MNPYIVEESQARYQERSYPMSAENAALAHQYHMDIFQAGNLAVADEILAPDFVIHSPGFPAELTHGSEGVKRFATAVRTALPDLQFTHEDIISQGDKAVIRWTSSGTHTGPWRGIPPTGRSTQGSGIDIFRIVDGKLVELWQEADNLGFLQQLGVIPAAEQSASLSCVACDSHEVGLTYGR
jgi:steroid delta-isomerase-like uncharacterized protein